MLEILIEDENWFVGAVISFFSLWVAILGTGHLFAVTTKMMPGILSPRIQPPLALSIGFAIAVPGWLLTARGMLLLRRPPLANLLYPEGITP
jgi:hypothetical protein